MGQCVTACRFVADAVARERRRDLLVLVGRADGGGRALAVGELRRRHRLVARAELAHGVEDQDAECEHGVHGDDNDQGGVARD